MEKVDISIKSEKVRLVNVGTLHRLKYRDMYTGVYVMYNKDIEVIYVGKTKDLSVRLASHRTSSPFYDEIHYIDFYKISDIFSKDIFETYLINKLRPKYNKAKTYFDENKVNEIIHEIDYKVDSLKQEIRYLKQDLSMINETRDNEVSGELDYDGFTKKSESEPIMDKIEEMKQEINRLLIEKAKEISKTI